MNNKRSLSDVKYVLCSVLILLFFLSLQSIVFSQELSRPATYSAEFKPLGEGVDWKGKLPDDFDPVHMLFKFRIDPGTVKSEINTDIKFNQENQTLSVEPRYVTDRSNVYVGKFSYTAGVLLSGEIIFDFVLPTPFFPDIPIYYSNPIPGFPQINKEWEDEKLFDSLLLEGDPVKVEGEVRDLLSIDLSAVDLAELIVVILSQGALPKRVVNEVGDIIKEYLADGGIRVNGGVKNRFTLTGVGIYVDGQLITKEDQTVAAASFNPSLDTYSIQSRYEERFTAGLDVVVSSDVFLDFTPLGIEVWSYEKKIVEVPIPIIPDLESNNLNFSITPDVITFPIDEDILLQPQGAIPTRSLTLGGSAVTIDVAQYFLTQNSLTYEVEVSPSNIVSASVSGSRVTITPVSPGSATVTVTARDTVNTNLTAIQTIPISVRQTQATIVRPANTGPIWRPVTISNPRAEGLREGVSVIVDGLTSGNNLNVRSGAGTNIPDIGDVTNGDYGIITDGPRSANGFTWWEIDWDTTRLDGWSAEAVGGVQLLFRRPPDLEIRDLDVSDSEVAPGEEIELEIEIRNNGPGESAATDVYIYYSEKRHSDLEELAEDSDLIGGWKLSVRSIRERRTETLTYRVDAPTVIGSYYYGAFLSNNIHASDNTDHLNEDAIRNNLAREERVRVIGAPDYIVDSIRLSGNRTTFDPGDSFTLRTTVRNIGLGEPSSSPTLNYYRSSDARISTSDRWLDDDNVSRLDTNETGSESVSLTAPTEPGVYYYGACVLDVRNESDRNNNCSGAIAITVRSVVTPIEVTGSPDLVVKLSSNSNLVDPNEYINLTANIRNQGDADTSNSTKVRYYLSSDTTVSSNDQLLATVPVSSLTQGNSDSKNRSVRSPYNPGRYYYYACVDSVTGENDTGNNCSNFISINVRGSDLVVESVSVDLLGQTTGINPNGEFTLNATIRNKGIDSAASTTARIYISADQTFSTTDDSEVQTASISSLYSWSSTTVQSSRIRSTYTSGVFYCFICLDSLSNETDTGNNCSEPIQITVLNVAPRAIGTIPVQALNVGTPKSIGVARYFTDANRDTLTYTANSNGNNIATAIVSNAQIIITPKRAGSVTITVTATDGSLMATQTISVTVVDPNHAPITVDTISPLTLTVGGAPEEIDVSSKFRDPDNDSLKYNASSNNTRVATATMTESKLSITPKSAGSATITVTATDGKLTATQTIFVTVIEKVIVNSTPTAVGTISARTLTVGDAAIQIDVSSNFQDPDDDTLTYTVDSNNISATTVSVSGSQVTITPVGAGSVTITVTASDGELTATQAIDVIVSTGVVSNRSPVTVGTISSQTLTFGDSSIQIDVSGNFNDPDDDTLTYSVNSNNTSA